MKSKVIDATVTSIHKESESVFLEISIEDTYRKFNFKKFRFEDRTTTRVVEAVTDGYLLINSIGIPRYIDTDELIIVDGSFIMHVVENILRRKGQI